MTFFVVYKKCSSNIKNYQICIIYFNLNILEGLIIYINHTKKKIRYINVSNEKNSNVEEFIVKKTIKFDLE